ncbi:hypothetical protein [Saccharopolyspora sp. NPDC049426]|uniref:hypothetical protein n=1 Tax=Saccharopolyspora sp. NPDC049426 TaxID=3155652 RepID=UPI00344A377E
MSTPTITDFIDQVKKIRSPAVFVMLAPAGTRHWSGEERLRATIMRAPGRLSGAERN